MHPGIFLLLERKVTLPAILAVAFRVVVALFAPLPVKVGALTEVDVIVWPTNT